MDNNRYQALKANYVGILPWYTSNLVASKYLSLKGAYGMNKDNLYDMYTLVNKRFLRVLNSEGHFEEMEFWDNVRKSLAKEIASKVTAYKQAEREYRHLKWTYDFKEKKSRYIRKK